MLSVPTLWTVFVVNFLALGLIWAYVMRSYPKFEAARFWTASAFVAAAGAALAMLRFAVDSLLPLLAGGTVLIFAACLAAMGIKRFYDQPVSWRGTALITGLSFAGLLFFIVGYDSMPMRILVYSLGQSLPLALTLKLLLSRQNGRINPGARLAGIVSALMIAHLCRPRGRPPAACRRRFLVRPLQPGPVGAGAGADVPVDGVEFRFPADGDGPAAQRGRRSGAARRSHRRRQPAASVAAADRGMRQIRAQRRAVRAAGDRSRRLQGASTTPTAMPPATPACSISP